MDADPQKARGGAVVGPVWYDNDDCGARIDYPIKRIHRTGIKLASTAPAAAPAVLADSFVVGGGTLIVIIVVILLFLIVRGR